MCLDITFKYSQLILFKGLMYGALTHIYGIYGATNYITKKKKNYGKICMPFNMDILVYGWCLGISMISLIVVRKNSNVHNHLSRFNFHG